MEQDFGSECSSECESGWTLYLGHSMYSCDPLQNSKNLEADYDDDDDDDDMSMVSDASSGPPHVQEQECDNNGVNQTGFHRTIQDFPGFLDDATASPFFEFSYVGSGKSSVGEGSNFINADYSEGESIFQDQFAYVKSSVSGNQLQQNQIRKP